MTAVFAKEQLIDSYSVNRPLKEHGEGYVEVAPNLFSLCSSNKIQAFFSVDEIINSWGQTAQSSVSWFMASGEKYLCSPSLPWLTA